MQNNCSTTVICRLKFVAHRVIEALIFVFRLYIHGTDMNNPATAVVNLEFTDLAAIEPSNPSGICIRGLANEPITAHQRVQELLVDEAPNALVACNIELLDRATFLSGESGPRTDSLLPECSGLVAQCCVAIEHRQHHLTACNILDNVTDAETGVELLAAHRRATVPWMHAIH